MQAVAIDDRDMSFRFRAVVIGPLRGFTQMGSFIFDEMTGNEDTDVAEL